MTFFHFINCVALSFAPYFIVYKYSGINEYSSIWKCANAAGGYLLTQLAKFLILATFFPTSDADGFAVVPELIKNSADIVDVIGLHLIMTNFMGGKGEVRFIAGGLGWGFAHSVSHRLILFWVGARASAFTWRWIHTSLESSSDLMIILSMAALTWMMTRTSTKFVVVPVLALCVFSSFVHQFAQFSLNIHGISLVFFRFAYAIAVSMSTVWVYSFNKNTTVKRE